MWLPTGGNVAGKAEIWGHATCQCKLEWEMERRDADQTMGATLLDEKRARWQARLGCRERQCAEEG